MATKGKRNIYLQMKSVEEAQGVFFDRISFEDVLKDEVIPTEKAVGSGTHSFWPA